MAFTYQDLEKLAESNNAFLYKPNKAKTKVILKAKDNNRFDLIKKFLKEVGGEGFRKDGSGNPRDVMIDGIHIQFKNEKVARGSSNTTIFESCYCWEAAKKMHGSEYKKFVVTPGVTESTAEKFLSTKADWKEAIDKSTDLIITHLENFSNDYKSDYSFERGSKNVKFIENVYRSLNKNIKYFSNINKWTPADIWMFKLSSLDKFKSSLSNAKNFDELNEALLQFSLEGTAFGFSLKKTSSPRLKNINFSIPIECIFHYEGYSIITGRKGKEDFFNSKSNYLYFSDAVTGDRGNCSLRTDSSGFLNWVIEINGPVAQHGKMGRAPVQKIFNDTTNLNIDLIQKISREGMIEKTIEMTEELEHIKLDEKLFSSKSDDWVASKYLGVYFLYNMDKLNKQDQNEVISNIIRYAKSQTRYSAPHIKLEHSLNRFKEKHNIIKEEKQHTVGLLPMAAKPVHEGHWKLIEYASNNADKVYVFVSTKDRSRPDEIPIKGTTVWNIWDEMLSSHLPDNVDLVESGMPIGDVYKTLNDFIEKGVDIQDKIKIFTGNDDVSNYPDKRLKKYRTAGLDVQISSLNRTGKESVNISGTKMREFLRDGNKEDFIKYVPHVLNTKEKEQYYNVLFKDVEKWKQTVQEACKTLMNNLKRVVLNEEKNIHATHIEDFFIDHGAAGFDLAIKNLKSLSDELNKREKSSNSTKSLKTLKIDGSPSVLFGTDEKGFFVSTKGAFAKTPKLCYTKEDCQKWFGKNPDLFKKIYESLYYLKQLNVKGIFQCDFLFDRDDLKFEEIEGVKYITFTPNTITYAIPMNSKYAEDISKSKIGIAVHTQYKGKDLASSSAVPIVNFADKYSNVNIWQMSLTLGSYVKTNESFFKDIDKELDKLQKEKVEIESFDSNFVSLFNIFINKLVREDNIELLNNPEKVEQSFKNYVIDRYSKEIAKLKTDAAIEKRKEKMQQINDYIKSIPFKRYMELYNQLRIIKNKLVREYSKGSQDIKTFVKEGGKYRETSHEGIAMSTDKGPGKFVDREEFSRLNFQKNKGR